MAGIYIHIPFCKQACSYCDFHFSTKLSNKKKVLGAIHEEINLRKDYLNGEVVETIYLGGGTPSLLEPEELDLLFEKLHFNFEISKNVEVTLEANPDDLTSKKLTSLKSSNINRLSIGIQSFFDKDLRFMNRAHTAEEAITSIKNAQDLGFENLNIDLIFGAMTTSDKMWEKNLSTFFDLELPHLSAYSLTVEEKTALAHQIQKGKLSPIDEEKNHRHYMILQTAIETHQSYQQYELSNYCFAENYSKHNTGYWQGKKYLGIGPSAHSFNGSSRQWNVSNNAQYINGIVNGLSYFDQELLSEIDQYHEYLITTLRTKWGLSFNDLISRFSKDIQDHFFKHLRKIDSTNVLIDSEQVKVHKKALFQSDYVVRQLMIA